MVRVKICGITNLDDAIMVVEEGADALGFVFFRESRRYIEPGLAGDISRAVPPLVCKVGVFVNEKEENILRIVNMVGLDAIQLHGDESPEFCARLAEHVKVIKAFRVSKEEDVEASFKYTNILPLFDTRSSQYGGSGMTFDWRILCRYREKLRYFVLSGGLTPANVGEAIRMLSPYAVDVSTGVESSPGKKDKCKVEAFIRCAKEGVRL